MIDRARASCVEIFGKATDDAMAEFIERKVFWQTKLVGEPRVWIGDPAEAQYVQTTPAHLIDINEIAALRTLESRDGYLHIGACVRHSAFERPVVPDAMPAGSMQECTVRNADY